MDDFAWLPALDIGLNKMNDEHRGLISIMGRLAHLNGAGVGKKKLFETFDDLIVTTQLHFSDEEELMKASRYPDLPGHKALHHGMLRKLEQHRDEYEKSPALRVPTAVFDFFRLWLTTHIMLVDRKYAEHCRSIGWKDGVHC